MNKSQIQAFLASLFATVNALPGLAFFPRVRAMIVKIDAAVLSEGAVIFASLPETFTAANLIDSLFVWARTQWPSELTALEVLQFVVDGVLVAAPSL